MSEVGRVLGMMYIGIGPDPRRAGRIGHHSVGNPLCLHTGGLVGYWYGQG